eukprot:TRINITY_DN10215_c0_g1_i2.p1 TRINITY_DN10215_c0_g1~~TRINITY_DN10215_c0_g1_i2.p1  ORF type:complete len:147 (-),score=19.05 TRINITY_DN10215_c0_g1_i2:25-465(-)
MFFLVSLLSKSIHVSKMEQQGLKGYQAILTNQIKGETDKNINIARALGFKINDNEAEDVLELVSIQSNLALDSELASAYLNRALVTRVPAFITQINLTAASANTVLNNNQFTPDTFIALSNLSKSLPQFEQQLLKHSLLQRQRINR